MLKADGHGLLFELGTPFMPAYGPFSDYFVRPTSGREIEDYLNVGWAPPIDGLFANTTIPRGSATVHGLRSLAAFVSHTDPDHVSLLPYVSPNIPVYSTPDVVRTLQAIGLHRQQLIPVQPGASFHVGPIRVVVHPIDHGPQGSAAFIAEVGGLRVAYTGDWRWHGRRPELINMFIEACRRAPLDVLITEGTRVRPPEEVMKDADASPGADGQTEAAADARLRRTLRSADGFVLYSFFARNIPRTVETLDIFREVGRYPVLHPDSVDLLEAYLGDDMPSCGRLNNAMLRESIRARPAKYVVEARLDNLPLIAELMGKPAVWGSDNEGKSRAVFLHMGGLPLGEYDPAWTVLHTWLRLLDAEYVGFETSGHASVRDLHRFISAIEPRIVVPVHTRHAPGVAPPGIHCHLYERGDELILQP